MAFTISCPHCTAKLKIPNESVLGKQTKCPKCKQAFQLPSAAQLKALKKQQEKQAAKASASPAPAPTPPAPTPPAPTPSEPVVNAPAANIPEVNSPEVNSPVQASPEPTTIPWGKNPRWVEETAAPVVTNPVAVAPTIAPSSAEIPVFDPAPTPAQTEASSAPFLPNTDSESEVAITPSPELAAATQEPAFPSAADPTFPGVSSSPESARSSRPVRKRKRRGSNMGLWIATAVLMVAGVGIGLFFQNSGSSGQQTAESTPPPENQVVEVNLNTTTPTRTTSEKLNTSNLQPITLLHSPAGARIVIHLRPAELWGTSARPQEFRYSFGSLALWVEQQMQALTNLAPTDIEELLITVILGPRGSEPEYAFVVRRAQPMKKSQWLIQAGGEPYDQFRDDMMLVGETVQHFVDESTLAVCPIGMADDLKASVDVPALTTDVVEDLLEQSDRSSQMTVVAEVADLKQHQQVLFSDLARPLIGQALDWFDNSADGLLWQTTTAQDFQARVIVYNRRESPKAVSAQVKNRFKMLPVTLVTQMRKMNPTKAGFRQLIGRLPAMVKLMTMTFGTRYLDNAVEFQWQLPAKAGPNLALATLLAWDESTRTDFTRVQVAVTKPIQKQKSVDELLKTHKTLIDFRNTPLQEAIAYMGEEIKVSTDIDGDALKSAGFTKNMSQTYKLGEVPIVQGFAAILTKYEPERDPLVMVVDEAKRHILITTRSFAKKQNLKEYKYK